MLIAKRMLSNKLHIMTEGKSTRIRGTICNVPIDKIDISSDVEIQT